MRRLKIEPFFRWYDLWIGLFYDRKDHALYWCPIPCCGLKFYYAKTEA